MSFVLSPDPTPIGAPPPRVPIATVGTHSTDGYDHAVSARPPSGLPVVAFPSQIEWTAWLDEHHAAAPGVWLRIAKKGAAEPTVSYQDALEAALCYGWIDGQKRRSTPHTGYSGSLPARSGAGGRSATPSWLSS